MAWRVTEAQVREIVQTDPTLSIAPFLELANVLVDDIHSNDSETLLSDTLLIQLEKLLAAHYYLLRDPMYKSKKTGQAEGEFQGETGKGFDSTLFGQAAKSLDRTGYLASMDTPGLPRANILWLGTELT